MPAQVPYRYRPTKPLAMLGLLLSAATIWLLHPDALSSRVRLMFFAVLAGAAAATLLRRVATVTVRLDRGLLVYDCRSLTQQVHREFAPTDIVNIHEELVAGSRGRQVTELVLELKGGKVTLCPLYSAGDPDVARFLDVLATLRHGPDA